MSTRSRIKFIQEENAIGAAYIPMDGHIENFAPELIAALKATTAKDILNNKEQRGNKLSKITLSFRLDLVGSIEQNRRRSRATLRIL
ncbi:MAG: hypothetical protein U9R60_03250 [Bacteroidota bacterium]|nr:hypothetical protein [Bacteroidota bacterium]